MKNKKRILLLVSMMAISVMFAGCQNADEADAKEPEAGQEVEQEEVEVDAEAEEVEESIELADWEGTWNNIVSYLDDEELKGAFDELADREGMSVEETKNIFKEDREVNFNGLVIEGNKAMFLDGFEDKGGEKIEEVEYEYKETIITKHDNFDTEWYLFESNKEGDYELLLLMPVHGEEALTHFHIRYGNNVEELLAKEDWYPTFVKPNSTYEQLYEEVTE